VVTTTEIFQRVRCANFQISNSHPLIGDNSRQDSCSGLGKRASAAIRDYESEIRSRVRFTTSMLQPLTSYEILHDVGQPYFDFARLDRINGHGFGAGANMEPAHQQTGGKI
jgi:hypothetical protein